MGHPTRVLMQDLFQTNSSTAASAASVINNPNNAGAASNPATIFGLNPAFNASAITGRLDLASIAINLNQFVLFWSAALSLVLVADFFFYYRLEGDGNLERESTGIRSIRRAVHVWLRYIPGWVCFAFASLLPLFSNFFEILAIIFFVVKIWGDLLTLTKISDYFDWFNKLAKPLNRILKFYRK